MIIYKITNKVNGKAYIGQTKHSLESRWKQHLLVGKSNYCRALKAAIAKYGKDSFYKEILSFCDSLDQLNAAESYFIDHFQTFGEGGYNLTSGGEGRRVSEQTKARTSLALKGQGLGKKMSLEARQKMSASKKGRPSWNKGKKGVQVAWNKGLPCLPQTKEAVRNANLGNTYRKDSVKKGV